MKVIKKILITGSSGTIGTRLFEKLLERGNKVVGFDKRPNIWHLGLDKLTIRGNLLNQKDINKIPVNYDLIVYLAANPYVHNSVLNPDLAKENMDMTYNILEFARRKKIKNFIFSSSREIYGNKEGKSPFKEKDVSIALSESPYAATKIGAEALIYAFSKCYGINYIVFRLSNVYGKYDCSDRFFPQMIRRMNKNQDVYIYGKDKFLDFTYIDDCTEGIISGIEKLPKVNNNTFNIATGKGCKLTKVARLLKDSLGSKSKIIVKPSQRGEVIKFIADISKARKELDYRPRYSLQRGIKLTLNWYLKNRVF